MYLSDLNDALVFLLSMDDERFAWLTRPETTPLINVGVGEDVIIPEVAELVASTVGYEGRSTLMQANLMAHRAS